MATLASSPAAAAAFAELRDSWEQRRLEPSLARRFLRRFPNDGAASLATLYLAFALIDSGDLTKADGELSSLTDLKPGAAADLATVARARSLRLHGAPQSALESLRPLVGKVIDDAEREVFLEELALTAIAAHDNYEALAYLDAWLRGVGESDRERVRLKINAILETLPRAVLEQTYRTMRQRGSASGYSVDTQKLVSARLARVAVDSADVALARWLLDLSGESAAQAGGSVGLELAELAASRRGLSLVSGKTVGLLLPIRTRELRDEAADVVRGVSFALELPRRAGVAAGVRLVTREDGGDQAGTRAAMEDLAGEGAAVILAGFDRASADRASAWSEQSGVPVLLLAAPSPSRMPKVSAFVLGERTERELAMLGAALVRHGVVTTAFVGDTDDDMTAARASEAEGLVLLPPTRCDVPLSEAGKPRFPVSGWMASGAQGWLISGPSSCARDVLRDVSRSLVGARGATARATEHAVAVTLEAGIPHAEIPRGLVVLSASAGLVPVLATRAEDARDEGVRAFMDRFGVRPSYWTALGRDAGALALSALGPLPQSTTSDPKAIVQRRAITQAGLFGSRLKLWTTDDTAMGSDRVLPRALRLVTWRAN